MDSSVSTKNKETTSFPESRVLTFSQLVHDMKKLSEDNIRFCFILGSGASVKSGIPNGQTMEDKDTNPSYCALACLCSPERINTIWPSLPTLTV